MNFVKKIVTISFINIFISSCLFSQKGLVSIGAGPAMGIPFSNKNFSYYYENGIGGSIQSNIGMTKLGSITANFLVVSIGAKRLPVTDNSSLTLLKIGYRTNFSDSRFFVSADMGLARYGSINLLSNSNFVIGGILGYSFTVSKESYIDLFPSYILILGTPNNNMWLTANVLYRFNLRKKKK
jgi:hypothetical protein